MNEKLVEALLANGAREWKKDVHHRIYITGTDIARNALKIEADHYKSGSVRSARMDGEKISNSEYGRLMTACYYYDVVDDQFYGDARTKTEQVSQAIREYCASYESEPKQISSAESLEYERSRK